jgi:hypothetical protein
MMPALLLVLLGCGGEPEAASISILSPQDGAIVCGPLLVVELEVAGIELVDPYGGTEEPGTGHIDIALNGQDVAMSDAERVEIPDVSDGVYQLKAELSNADHTPVEPYAGDFVYITVDAESCVR